MAEKIVSPGVFLRENDLSFVQPAPAEAGTLFLGPTVKGPIEEPTVVTSYNEYVRKFGSTFKSGSDTYEFMTSMAVRNFFAQGGTTALVARVAHGTFSAATSTNLAAVNQGSTVPFTLQSLGKGSIYNTSTAANDPGAQNLDGSLSLGTSDNLRWEVSNVNSAKGTFTVTIRRGDDNTSNKIILETFSNVSLDPKADNYIEKVIGNQTTVKGTDGDSVFITKSGEYPNKSNFVRVSSVNLKTPDYLANDGKTINLDSNDDPYSDYLPVAASGSFYGGLGDVYMMSSANYYENITSTSNNMQGLVGADYNDAIAILSNKDDYQFNVVVAPGLIYSNGASYADGKGAINAVISLAEGRGDAIAVVDLVEKGSQIAAVTTQADLVNTSYGATYWPWLQVGAETGKNVWVPASTVIPGVYAFTDAAAAPWFAPAGLVRGGLVGVIDVERKLPTTSRDTLYEAKVNPIASFPGAGIAVYGQKTLQTKSSALDRVNVRRLMIELKKFFADQARGLVFEQNTIATRNNFLAAVNPYLESVVSRNGLYAYRVVMDDTNNTADVIDRNQLIGQIYIQPAKTAEFIVLDFTIEPTGATFTA